MKAPKRQYQCEQCGATATKWAGQCGECGQWNTLVETLVVPAPSAPPRYANYSGDAPRIVNLADVAAAEEPRMPTGLSELDRVLGGGLVPGSVVLIGGDPGIGKSTLLLQSLAHYGGIGVPTLYVSGEESAAQIALRADRLKLARAHLRLLTETDIERVLAIATQEKPSVLVIDSIQTVYTPALSSAPGSVAQVRECAAQLVRYAKATQTAVYLVGHVTKEGALAGPRVLEHMVDAVLYFEGELGGRYRLVRAFKNRFGAVNELGVFGMTDRGLREVTNPSAILLSRHEQPVAGSVVMVTREGTRPLLVEVQALVDSSALGNPRRVTVGLDGNRLAMLLAVLHRHGGVSTAGCDVFANIVGGVRVTETGGDLAVVLAVLSSLRDRPVPGDLVVFGEIGLAGEIRPVQNGPERLREAAKHGFKRAIVPKANAPKQAELELIAVSRLADALGEI
ncbi:MAG: DNA repair protein RadA [Gammaproteobacteria bacterium]